MERNVKLIDNFGRNQSNVINKMYKSRVLGRPPTRGSCKWVYVVRCRIWFCRIRSVPCLELICYIWLTHIDNHEYSCSEQTNAQAIFNKRLKTAVCDCTRYPCFLINRIYFRNASRIDSFAVKCDFTLCRLETSYAKILFIFTRKKKKKQLGSFVRATATTFSLDSDVSFLCFWHANLDKDYLFDQIINIFYSCAQCIILEKNIHSNSRINWLDDSETHPNSKNIIL